MKEDKIDALHKQIKEIFPDAVSVDIFVNAEEINVDVKYKTNTQDFSMQTINQHWVKRGQ